MKYLISVIFLVIVCGDCYSDELDEGVRYYCHGDTLEIEQLNLMNNETVVLRKAFGERAYLGYEQHNFKCELGEHVVEVSLKNREPKERGMCGAAPGSYISIILDGEVLINNASLGNECYESLEKMKFVDSKWVGFVFNICGHNAGSSNPHFSGCMEFKEGLHKKIPMPFGRFPISHLIKNNALNLKLIK